MNDLKGRGQKVYEVDLLVCPNCQGYQTVRRQRIIRKVYAFLE
jgi:hypothetical protein